MNVAGYQMSVTQDIGLNKRAIIDAIHQAAGKGAEILLTPEGSLSGYRPDFEQLQVERALNQVLRASRDAGIALALGTCFRESNDLCYNQVRFYDASGEYLGFHSKTLCCGSHDDPPKGEINDYAVSPLRTFDLSGITVGALVCNDLWANPGCTPMPDPHLTQQLSEMGARIIFHAVNGGRSPHKWSQVAWQYHESNLQMRARAGRIWIATVDSSNPATLPCSAPSGVVAPDGNWVCRTEAQGEDLFVYQIETKTDS